MRIRKSDILSLLRPLSILYAMNEESGSFSSPFRRKKDKLFVSEAGVRDFSIRKSVATRE